MSEVATEAAGKAVEDCLTRLGVDQSDPLETQRDMAFLRELRGHVSDPETQADLLHLRKWRKAMDGVETKGLLTLVAIVVTGLAAATWIGVQSIFTK